MRKHIFAGANRVCSVNSQTGTQANPQTYYYHSDHLGSSNVITDQTGQQVQSCEYTPYGTLTRNEGTDVVTHKFTGKELDNTGLYFYGARYYDPEIGRFITADTIVQAPYNPQSLNRYSYCRNNPINYIDPTGHFSWKKFWHSGAGALVGGIVAGVLTGGFGFGLMAAGFWGGMAGGALTGGLEGGWKGALIGGVMGGALGALGGWAGSLNNLTGNMILGGMLAAGVGYAAATNSWDSLAGGLIGGTAGYGIGNSVGKSIAAGRSPNLASETGSARIGKGEVKAASSLETDQKPYFEGNKEIKPAVLMKKGELGFEPVDSTGHRYVGPEEAAKVAEIGYVPNVNKSGISKSVFYTPDEGLASASQAQRVYNLQNIPTHRIDIDTTHITNIYGGNVQGGTGIEMITNDEIPVMDIQKLRK